MNVHPSPPPAPDDNAPPRPIGPERLRALREAILSGTYPLDQAATQGLTSLFRGPKAPSGHPSGGAGKQG